MPYKDNLEAAYSRISALEHEKSELEDKLKGKKKEKKVKCYECGGSFYRVGVAAFWSVAGFLFAAATIWFFVHIAQNHGPTHCYIESKELTFELKRNVDWGEDEVIGRYRLIDEAIKDAEKIKCKIQY